MTAIGFLRWTPSTTSAQDRSMNKATVAVLGAGALGTAIAARLGDTGHQ